jgi:ribonuclease HI
MSLKRIKIYTDGSCLKNPGGKGGYGFLILSKDGDEIQGFGHSPSTTNNIMELTAVIEAIKYYKKIDKKQTKFHIVSDSKYVINCAKGEWQRKKNKEVWERYDKYAKGKDITFTWVKGHSGDKYNEIVDKLANKGSNKN